MAEEQLNKAMAEAAKELKNPALDAVNPHFKSKFASLAEVRNAIVPVFAKHGLVICQHPVTGQNQAGVHTYILHSSGEERDCGQLLLPLSKNDAQGAGSAITYARRYSMQSVAGVVAEEDDDGNEASKPAKAQPAPAPKPQAVSTTGSKPANQAVPGVANSNAAPPVDWAGKIAKAESVVALDEIASELGRLSEDERKVLRPLYKARVAQLEAK